jgi:hypothetical protein
LYTFDLNATSSTVDLKTYNLGNFFLALDGVPQDGKDYGYLAVEYDVELLDKNPITADSVFASLTYDSAAPAAKRDRSNVDPADTMEVSTDWKIPTLDALTNPLVITFSEDVPIGAKVRLAMYVSAELENTASSYGSVTFGAPTVPEGVIVLTQRTVSISVASKSTATPVMYLNLDITVPSERSITVTMASGSNAMFDSSTSSTAWSVDVMAYSYA